MIGLTLARPGVLFAIAFAGALLFASSPAGAMSYSVIYRFQGGTDGAFPVAGLNNLGGTFYGTTNVGGIDCGSAGCGTFFSVTAAGVETPVYSFQGGSDGANPYGGVTNASGTLYGTTAYGGGSGCGGTGCGTVYTITTSGAESTFYKFQGGSSDGANPLGAPLVVGSSLYGTTQVGGSAGGCTGCGTVYSINTATKHENWVYSFKGGINGDGEVSYSHLVKVGKLLYGTTDIGGNTGCAGAGCGTVFSIGTHGTENVVYRFDGNDGYQPFTGVIAVNGVLYGTTAQGGGTGCRGSGCGTIYSISTSGALNWVHSFNGGSDGWQPGLGGLLFKGGTLYGTTNAGGGTGCGGSGCGTVFSITVAGANYKRVYAFTGGSDGLYPNGSLNNTRGTLYGTTSYGGGSGCSGNGCGTVFKLKP